MMLQVIVIVMIIVVIRVVDAVVLHTVAARHRSPVLISDTGRDRAARISLKNLVHRKSMLVHRVCWDVLHLGGLVKMNVAVRVVQVLPRMRH